VDRELVLLEGNGLRLRFDDGELVELHPPHERLRFSGERALRGELVDGPTRDFNLMWKREAVDARLWHRPLVGSMLLFAEPASTWALHVLAGQVRLQDGGATVDAAQGDTLLLPGGAASRRRYPLDGGGELLVIRLLPAGLPATGAADGGNGDAAD
jgi:environmental stress-induced protein Ves